ncbi:MAG TPA: hypothetical protein VGN26_09335, partial [Armatimonadota bacterium]
MSSSRANGTPPPRWLVRLGAFFFKVRNQLFTLLLLVMVFALHPVQAGGTEASDRLWNLVGLLVAAAGESLRVLVIGTRYIRRGGL